MSISHGDEAYLTANGMQLCYDTFGKPGDSPLILVMGLGSQMILWDDDFCRLLASQGRYVVRFDNRDIGRSTYLDEFPVPNLLVGFLKHFLRRKIEAPYTLVDMARDTIGVMDALGFARADVVGASMGGAIVQELAVHFPRRLRSATMIMSSSGDPKLERPTVAAFRALMKPPPRDRDEYLEHYASLWVALSGDGYAIDPVRTQRQGEIGYARGIHPSGAARQFGAILASGNRKPGLRTVDTSELPVLVIQGQSDPLIRPSHGRDLAATIPGAKLELIEGMGHTLPEKCWAQIAQAIAVHAPPAVRA